MSTHAHLKSIETEIERCMLRDRPRLGRRLRELGQGGSAEASIERLRCDVAASVARRAARVEGLPRPRFASDLPVVQCRAELAEAIERHPVVVVCGETGSGKTTQLPQICLELGRGTAGLIGHTQPRRLAARSVANRIAEELGTPLGQVVGYTMRFDDVVGADAYVKIMTDGILLAETRRDRLLLQYDTIIIDEAHERSLNIDFLLGYLHQLRPRRPDLKLIITSATIDPRRFSDHFDEAPIIEVGGRTHPIDVRYRPLTTTRREPDDRQVIQGILDAVDELIADGEGDVLVFLSGEREIRQTAKALRGRVRPGTDILPLYARLPAAEQARVFTPHPGRRIVLATNVAETSLTVPGIRGVVDPGLARISRYSARRKVQRLLVEPISRASADQRAGRCGRVGPGTCIRLYAEDDYDQRDPFTAPEVMRSNLASVILQMKALQLGEIEHFGFLDPPRPGMIRDGVDTLHELGAVDDDGRLTDMGRRLAGLPVDPRIGRMILGAHEEGSLCEVLIIAAALSIQDPRYRSSDAPSRADEAHARFADERSDFLTFVNLWEAYHEQRLHGPWSAVRAWCEESHVSFVRMLEWHDVHRQLKRLVTEAGMTLNREPADPPAVHRALLRGLLSQVGRREREGHYTGAGSGSFWIFPGSTLARKTPRWIMAAQVVETTRHFARTVAPIDPAWIERLAPHLVKRRYGEPVWDERRGRVMVPVTVSLFGLDIVARRLVAYASIDPVGARDLFIQHGLVEDRLPGEAPFRDHNRGLVEQVRTVEDKIRRRSLLVDDETRRTFYDRVVPADVCTAGALEAWRRRAEREDPRRLFMTWKDLTGADVGDLAEAYPDELTVGGLRLPLSYHYEPGHAADGVTVTVPLAALNQLRPEHLDRLVPGLLPEKVTAMIRGLPKDLRRSFLPVAGTVEACLPPLRERGGPLAEALATTLRSRSGLDIPATAWRLDALASHLRMNVRVVDDDGEVAAEGRDLGDLTARLGRDAVEALQPATDATANGPRSATWEFGDLPESAPVQRGGITITAYPALVDEGDAVSVRLFDCPHAARGAMRPGLQRLFVLQIPEEIDIQIDHLPELESMVLRFAPLGDEATLRDGLARLIADRAFLAEGDDIRTIDAFEARLHAGRSELWAICLEVGRLVDDILAEHHALACRLEDPAPASWAEAVCDVRARLNALMAGFPLGAPYEWLRQYPRYLRALSRRLEKLPNGGHSRDAGNLARMAPLRQACGEALERLRARAARDPELDRYRWMLEEMEVSIFAQELGTAVPVSFKRLEKQWGRVGR